MSTGDTTCQLKLNGEVTRNVDHVKYPGSTISADGTLSKDLDLRALVSHKSWWELTWVLYEKKMPFRLQSNIYSKRF